MVWVCRMKLSRSTESTIRSTLKSGIRICAFRMPFAARKVRKSSSSRAIALTIWQV